MPESDSLCDLRSDTVTLPSPEMRAAMAAAPVGDDQYGEDPTMNRLQERIAALLGKEAALWMPSGTMVNQVALRVLTQPGDDVIVSRESHAVWHETGAAGANAGVQFSDVGARGVFTVDEFLAARKPRGHIIYPPTTLVEIENTHNRAGGVIFPQDEVERICAAAREHDIASYLDGARLWNVAVATGRRPAELAAPFDLVGVALSKGLGAPGGSLLTGSRISSSALCATGGCPAEPCGRLASSLRRACTPWTTISSVWLRITPMPGVSASGWQQVRESTWIWTASRRTSWSST